MTTGNTMKLPPLEVASKELNDMISQTFSAEEMHNALWDMFTDSMIHRGDQGGEYDLYPRVFLYNSLRNLFTELSKIKHISGHEFKITFEPENPQQS